MPLSTDFKDDILNSSVNAKRKYQQTYNDDGSVSFTDVTTYSQNGSEYGAGDVNEERTAINRNTNAIGSEDEYSSSKNYSAGDYFIYENNLCKALTNISSGTELSSGDNYEVTNIKTELSRLNGKFVYESKVIDAKNDSWYYFGPPGSSYELISAMNGDWDAKGVRVTGVAKQPKTNVGIVFFETSVTGKMRINLLWVKG